MWRGSFETTVHDVYQDKGSGVWYVRILRSPLASVALCVGEEKPELALGDKLKLTLERIE